MKLFVLFEIMCYKYWCCFCFWIIVGCVLSREKSFKWRRNSACLLSACIESCSKVSEIQRFQWLNKSRCKFKIFFTCLCYLFQMFLNEIAILLIIQGNICNMALLADKWIFKYQNIFQMVILQNHSTPHIFPLPE